MFNGFSQDAVDFLWGIRFHNERSWFLEHKEEYHTFVETPLRQLADQVSRRMEEEFPELRLEKKVSRIYRDARRLHGRGPYKEHMWFSLRRRTEAEGAQPSFYFEIAPEYYSYGMGCYDPTPLTMAKLRARIDRDPAPLEKLARQLEGQEEFVLEGESYKRAKGDPGPLLFPWYNRRQIVLSSDHNCEGLLFQPQLEEQVVKGFRFLVPYYRFLTSVTADPPPPQP
ncbi:DUF2461 domain-containing protein [Flavonifractor sp. An100]|uniref:DUF2461 domain-containing protein n=1 Tax=Flavonifractor sp. An100 TaxID=1965538 RepID=UPI000B36A28A|nr:DUF2461 domain-containing protein [Flavonifractor sp. An100]OUQ77975.1 hypothetical protein B5E43_09720 [Flavonifractor sp. An100]